MRPAQAQGGQAHRRAGVHTGRAAAGRDRLDRGPTRRAPPSRGTGRATGCRVGGHRHAAWRDAAGVPGEPAQAAQGCALPGGTRDHVRRRRGGLGRLRHRACGSRAAGSPRWSASPVQRNMTKAFFFDLSHLNRGGSRPKDVPATLGRPGRCGRRRHDGRRHRVRLRQGRACEVVLVDVSLEAAERGKAYSQQLLDKAVARGRSTVEKRDAHLARITATADLSALAGCDLVIEAVFEDLDAEEGDVRQGRRDRRPGQRCSPRTPHRCRSPRSRRPCSTRPIFVGLHFFSPVDKMPLVEIVRGKQTSDDALARGYDLVRAIDKTPIVVNDSRGFFTSRVFGTYVMEGIALLAEGVPAASVEQAALQAGYPVGPLAVTDEVTLTLGRKDPGRGPQGRRRDSVHTRRDRGGPDDRRVRPARKVVGQGLLRLPGRRIAEAAVAGSGRGIRCGGAAAGWRSPRCRSGCSSPRCWSRCAAATRAC